MTTDQRKPPVHYRTFYDTKYIGAWSLGNEDCIVVIKRVKGAEVEGEDGRKARKLTLFLDQFDKPLVLNVTNAKTIAAMYGTDVRNWPGKRIAIYATTTKFSGKPVECIRVRPTIPEGPTSEKQPDRPVDPEMRERQQQATKGE